MTHRRDGTNFEPLPSDHECDPMKPPPFHIGGSMAGTRNSRRRAAITQADIARVIRAAKKAGAPAIEVKPDGSVIIRLIPLNTESPSNQLEADTDIAL